MKCGLRPVLQKPNVPCTKQQIGDSQKPKPKEEEREAHSSLLSHDIRRAFVRTVAFEAQACGHCAVGTFLHFLSRSTSERNSSQQGRVKQKVEEIREISGSLSRLIREKAEHYDDVDGDDDDDDNKCQRRSVPVSKPTTTTTTTKTSTKTSTLTRCCVAVIQPGQCRCQCAFFRSRFCVPHRIARTNGKCTRQRCAACS